jgi:hypothetical protein
MTVPIADRYFSGLVLVGAVARGALFRNVNFSFSDLSHCQLERSSFENCQFQGTRTIGATFGSIRQAPVRKTFSDWPKTSETFRNISENGSETAETFRNISALAMAMLYLTQRPGGGGGALPSASWSATS